MGRIEGLLKDAFPLLQTGDAVAATVEWATAGIMSEDIRFVPGNE